MLRWFAPLLAFLLAGSPALAVTPCPPLPFRCYLGVEGKDGCNARAEWILEGTVTNVIDGRRVVLSEDSITMVKGTLDATKREDIGQYSQGELTIDFLVRLCGPRPAPTSSLIDTRQRFFGTREGYFAFEVVK